MMQVLGCEDVVDFPSFPWWRCQTSSTERFAWWFSLCGKSWRECAINIFECYFAFESEWHGSHISSIKRWGSTVGVKEVLEPVWYFSISAKTACGPPSF